MDTGRGDGFDTLHADVRDLGINTSRGHITDLNRDAINQIATKLDPKSLAQFSQVSKTMRRNITPTLFNVLNKAATATSTRGHITNMNRDVLNHMADKLDPKSLAQLSQTSKTMRANLTPTFHNILGEKLQTIGELQDRNKERIKVLDRDEGKANWHPRFDAKDPDLFLQPGPRYAPHSDISMIGDVSYIDDTGKRYAMGRDSKGVPRYIKEKRWNEFEEDDFTNPQKRDRRRRKNAQAIDGITTRPLNKPDHLIGTFERQARIATLRDYNKKLKKREDVLEKGWYWY